MLSFLIRIGILSIPSPSPRSDKARIGASHISKRYGSVHANIDVTFSVECGQVHAVVGENGAGKSTLMRILQGLEKPDTGHVILDGQPISFRDPKQAIAAGIGMVHQEFMLAPNLTLLENLVLGDEPKGKTLGLFPTIDWKQALAEAEDIQGRAGVSIDWNRQTAACPVHVLQYVEIFRLLRRGSDVLILDEPTAVLAPQQVDQLFELLGHLRDQGSSIIFISHKLREVETLANHVTIMRKGEVVASAPVAQLDGPAMTRYIMGDAMPSDVNQGKVKKADRGKEAPVLVVSGLSTAITSQSHPLHEVSLQAHTTEIVGIAGVAGNGQEELMQCLAGLRDALSGSILLNGKQLINQGNKVCRANGIGYISPDRAHEGLAKLAGVEANVIAGSQWQKNLVLGPFQRWRRIHVEAKQRLQNFDVQYGALADPVSSLSGGNQQKLVFARETATKPKVLVVSQPTRGVDLNGIAAIHSYLQKHRDAGGSVILASEEIDELMALCDRIFVMSGGRLVGQIEREDFSPQLIGKLMLTSQGEGEHSHE